MFNRIKYFSIIISLSAFMISCGGSGSFTVTGNMDGWANDSIVVQELLNNSLHPIKTLNLDKKGHFEFSDTASNPRFLFLQTSDNKYISLLTINGQNITISANKDNFEDSYKVSGSEESQLVWELNSEMRKASLELDS